MINYFELRASDMAASGDDPYAAVNAELFIGQWYAFSASHHNAQLKYRYSVLVFLQLIGVILNILLYV